MEAAVVVAASILHEVEVLQKNPTILRLDLDSFLISSRILAT